MPNSPFAKFDVYWWVAASGPTLSRYATRRPADINCFSPAHYQIHAHSLDGTGEILEIILFEQDGAWSVKCDDFDDPTEAYPFSFSESESESLWTDATGDELMVIQASAHTD